MTDTGNNTLDPYRLMLDMVWVPSSIYGVSVVLSAIMIYFLTLDFTTPKGSSKVVRKSNLTSLSPNGTRFSTQKILRTPKPVPAKGEGFIRTLSTIRSGFGRIRFTNSANESLLSAQDLLYFSTFFFVSTFVYGMAIFSAKEEHCNNNNNEQKTQYDKRVIYPFVVMGVLSIIIMLVTSHYWLQSNSSSSYLQKNNLLARVLRFCYDYNVLITALLLGISASGMLYTMNREISRHYRHDTNQKEPSNLYTSVLMTMAYIVMARILYLLFIHNNSTQTTLFHLLAFGGLFIIFSSFVYGDIYVKHMNNLFLACPTAY